MLGAHLMEGGGCAFSVWAPRARKLALEWESAETGRKRLVEMRRDGDVHVAQVEEAQAGDRYFFVFEDGRKRPDPRSLRQPFGVHGPSEVVDLRRIAELARAGEDRPRKPLCDWVIYELHVGTFTPEGTFDALASRLDDLVELGISAVELMPISPFPGDRNWGYDGVAPFAVHEAYGGPEGLARFVSAAHARGLAVVLDVVYNHLGPEGNYLREFAPYFTDRYETPWGEAIDYDGEGSGPVRAWAIENAAFWVRTYGVDALRLDAVQAIHDHGAPPHVVAEIGRAVQEAGGFVIAESDLNDPVVVEPRPEGWGLDAQWSDDLHHALHAILTGERTGYYEDFGEVADVAKALSQGFVYDGTRPSRFRGRTHGKAPGSMPAEAHVVCIQNHDQIGNRARGDRIAQIAGLEAAKLGAAVVLSSSGIPLLFMGEEYAAPQPFPFFTSHGDPGLVKAVRLGRRHEFSAFRWQGEVPDPQAESTFLSAKLHDEERRRPPHDGVCRLYRELLSLRSTHPALRGTGRKERSSAEVVSDSVVRLERWGEGRHLLLFASFAREETSVVPRLEGSWQLLLDTADRRFSGPGGLAPETLVAGQPLRLAPLSACLYERVD
jgi:maltooligosyltrehalose trehalohydrolase